MLWVAVLSHKIAILKQIALLFELENVIITLLYTNKRHCGILIDPSCNSVLILLSQETILLDFLFFTPAKGKFL